MHITKLCTYAICTYPELSSIEIPYIKTGLASFYAHKQIMHLSIMHLSGINCTPYSALLNKKSFYFKTLNFIIYLPAELGLTS